MNQVECKRLNKSNYISIVGDTHNVESLKNILNKFDNIVSMGDIGAAVPKDIFKNNQLERYRKTWKAFSKQDSSMSEEDKNWFKKINVDSWIQQINNIKNSSKNFTLMLGNSDMAMIGFFPECKECMDKSEQANFKVIRKPEIRTYGNVQIILFPFTKEKFDFKEIIAGIDNKKKLFVLTHCPAFEKSQKKYYEDNYNLLKEISEKYKDKFFYIHGHMHPSFSYKYSLKSIPNIIFLAPKAEESFEGFGINNQVIQLQTQTGEFKLIDSITNKLEDFKELPERYYTNEDHWNDFDDKSINNSGGKSSL